MDYLPQFFMLPNFISNSPVTKYNVISPDWENFNNQSFLEDFEKVNWNQVFQWNQDNVIITFDNYLTIVNTLINSHAPFKDSTKNKERLNKNHGLQKKSKVQFKIKTDSLKSKLHVYINDRKHIERAYQIHKSKVKNVFIIIFSERTLLMSKAHGKELNQQFP